jgi:hypothetical protein
MISSALKEKYPDYQYVQPFYPTFQIDALLGVSGDSRSHKDRTKSYAIFSDFMERKPMIHLAH